MTTAEIGKTLVGLCREGKFLEAIQTLYSPDIVSVEAGAPEGMGREVQGLDAVLGKAHWWQANHEVHSATVDGPFCNPESFAVVFSMDVTFKPTGKQIQMKEVAVYTVVDGKITHETFLYAV